MSWKRSVEREFAMMPEAGKQEGTAASAAGWAVCLLERMRGRQRPKPRLTLVERISLAPRQSLALVEVDGRRLLVATAAEGAPAFYSLHAQEGAEGGVLRVSRAGRVSW